MAKNDSALEKAMRSHRPREGMSGTAFGTLEQESQAPLMVPVEAILPSPFQSRGATDETHIEALMASISDGGLLSPVLVRKVSDSDTFPEKFELVAGHNRVEAFRRLGRESIPTIVREMSDREAARALTVENTAHKTLADWELFKHIVMLRAANAVKNVTDLAAVLGCSRAQVYNLEAFAAMPAVVIPMLDEQPGLIGATLAYELKSFFETHPDLVVEGIELLAAGKIKQAGVIGWVERKAIQKVAPYRREVLICDGDRTIKLVTTDGDARVTGNLNFEKLHELIEKNLEALRKH